MLVMAMELLWWWCGGRPSCRRSCCAGFGTLTVEGRLCRDQRLFRNKAERVKAKLWDFFRCEPGMEAVADMVATRVCKKLVVDMHYEVRLQCIRNYYGVKKQRVTKDQLRTMTLTREQYLQIIPHWCVNKAECWERMVDWWRSEEWSAAHAAGRERRLMMPGASHHQGSRGLSGYASSWSSSHGGQPCSSFMAYALSHKGKATSSVQYNPDDPPEAYTNPVVHARLTEYTSMARQVHGQDYDPSAHDLDGELVMRAGGGKKHGRYAMGDSTIDKATTPTLSQIRASSTSASPAIRPRPTASQHGMSALQAQLEAFQARQEADRLRMEAMEAQRIADQQRMGALEAKAIADQQQVAMVMWYMEQLRGVQGLPPPPPEMFLQPSIPTPPGSAGSHNPTQHSPTPPPFPSPHNQFHPF